MLLIICFVFSVLFLKLYVLSQKFCYILVTLDEIHQLKIILLKY